MYLTPTTIYGMLGTQAIKLSNLTWAKNKKQDVICTGDKNYNSDVKEIRYMYIDEKPKSPIYKDVKKDHEIVWGVFDEEYFKLKGGHNKHKRQYQRKYDSRIEVIDGSRITDKQLEDILTLIKDWEMKHGKKRYRMMMHSTYDKRFFCDKRFLEADKFQVFVFCDKVNNRIVGYSVYDKTPTIEKDLYEYRCMLRKTIYENDYRDLCEWVDLKSANIIYETTKHPFVINMGTASTSGMKSYKLNKFPVYKEREVWFYKLSYFLFR